MCSAVTELGGVVDDHYASLTEVVGPCFLSVFQLCPEVLVVRCSLISRSVHGVQGWHSGESTCLPPMSCGPGWIPRLGIICGLSLLVLYSAPRGFSPGTPVSPLLKNQHLT